MNPNGCPLGEQFGLPRLGFIRPAVEVDERLHADAGYRGHNAPPDYKFKVYTSKQKRGVTQQIEREMRHRSAIEPVIGHL